MVARAGVGLGESRRGERYEYLAWPGELGVVLLDILAFLVLIDVSESKLLGFADVVAGGRRGI